MGFDQYYGELIKRATEGLFERLGAERAAELMESEENPLAKAMPGIIEETAEVLAAELKRGAPEMLAQRRANLSAYEALIERYWGKAFDLLEMLVVMSFETGVDFLETYADEAEADQDLVFYVLTRLQVRACRIAEEAAVLIKAGYGQGAQARWRALHEVVVVAMFIAEHGQEVAQRYLLHEGIESYRAIEEYRERVERLPGYEPPSEQELVDAKENYEELIAEFGKSFGSAYGWATEALARNAKLRGRQGFGAIEEDVELDHLRSHYRMASHPVHANPKGILATPDQHPADDALLAGPSIFGLADPGHAVCISLVTITITVLASRSGMATGFIGATMLKLSDEAGDVFLAAEEAVVAEGVDLGEKLRDGPSEG